MGKFLINCILCVMSLTIMDFILYNKAYNEALIMESYLIYDIKNSNITSFENDEYVVNINYMENEEVNYKIIRKRDTVTIIDIFKKIEIDGIVEQSNI